MTAHSASRVMHAARQVGYAITTAPEDFHMHRGVKRVYEQRRGMIDSGEGIDWGMAEALAFGTLISEGRRPAWVAALSFGTWLPQPLAHGHLVPCYGMQSLPCCRCVYRIVC